MKPTRLAGIALALCLVAASPARAAFAPDLSVAVDPPTASGMPAVTLAIAQPVTDGAIQRLTLRLPSGFTATDAPGADACPRATLRAGACAGSSRVGTFAGALAGGDTFRGPIHKTGAGGFGLYLSILGGSVAQLVPGSVETRPDGSLDLRLERMPALPLSALTLRLEGGSRGLVMTPATCADYTVDGLFTSHLGELAIDRTSVPITGCSGVPAVAVQRIRFSKRRFRKGRGTIVAWWASRAADHTKIRIERHKRGRWRRIGSLTGPASAGDNRIRWNGRLRGRALKPGRYRLRIHPAGSAPSKRVGFKIIRRRR